MKRVVTVGILAAVFAAGVYLEVMASARLAGGDTHAVLRGHAADLHASLMQLEDRVPAGAPQDATWKTALVGVHDAVAAGDASAAAYRWREAYTLALATRAWEPLIEVGDAALRRAALSEARRGDEANAREAYMAAVLRARRAGSAEGTLRSAEAFARLGDRETARVVRAMGERLASARPRRAL
jgi:hypothetical protein